MRVREVKTKRVITEVIDGYGGGIAIEEDLNITGDLAVTGALSTSEVITASEGVVLGATAVSGVTTLLSDASGDALFATGTTVPTDATSGFAKGCLFIDTDVSTGTTGLNCNKGTNTSCVFTAITQA